MNTSSRRAKTRLDRQIVRRDFLTKADIDADPEACKRFMIFGKKKLPIWIALVAKENRGKTKRQLRYERRIGRQRIKNEKLMLQVAKERKKHKEKLTQRMQKLAMRIRRQQG